MKKPVLIHGKNKYRLLFAFIPTVGRGPTLSAEINPLIYANHYKNNKRSLSDSWAISILRCITLILDTPGRLAWCCGTLGRRF